MWSVVAAVRIAVVVGLIDVHVHLRAGLKILFPRLVRHPCAVEIQAPQLGQPGEDAEPCVTDRHIDQMQGAETGEFRSGRAYIRASQGPAADPQAP